LLVLLANPENLPPSDRSQGWQLRAQALLATGRDDDARQAFEQAIQSAPDNAPANMKGNTKGNTAARLGLARLALRQDDLDAAYTALREARASEWRPISSG